MPIHLSRIRRQMTLRVLQHCLNVLQAGAIFELVDLQCYARKFVEYEPQIKFLIFFIYHVNYKY